MNSIPLADIAALKPVVDYLQAGGACPDRYLDAVNISPELVHKGEGKTSKRQLYRFLADVSRREGLPDLGFRFGEGYFPAGMGSLARAVLQAPTLKDAIHTFDSLLRHWMGENRTWLEPEGEYVWLCNAADDGFQLQRDASTQCCILVLIELVRLAAGPDWLPRSVLLEMRPSSAHAMIDSLSEAKVGFHPEVTAVAFPADLLAYPLHYGKKVVPAGPVLKENPREFIPSLTTILRDQITYGIVPRLEMTAEAIGTSTRSFQRRLQEAGLTYRRLIDRVRFEISRKLLEDPTVRVRDISASLGYSSPNNFVRAFRRISGMTPTEYRNYSRDRQIVE